MSYNLEYVQHALNPFGGMTKDMLKLLKLMKTEKFICVQTLGQNDSIYVLRGQENEDEFNTVENVMTVSNFSTTDQEEFESFGKTHEELARAVDRTVVHQIVKFAENCEELPMDSRAGLSASIRSAGLALSSKLMRLSRLAVMGDKRLIQRAIANTHPNLATLACNIDDVIVFNAGTMSFDGGVFFVPLSLDKRNGLTLRYKVVTDDAPRNFLKLIEGYEPEELTLSTGLPESEREFLNELRERARILEEANKK